MYLTHRDKDMLKCAKSSLALYRIKLALPFLFDRKSAQKHLKRLVELDRTYFKRRLAAVEEKTGDISYDAYMDHKFYFRQFEDLMNFLSQQPLNVQLTMVTNSIHGDFRAR